MILCVLMGFIVVSGCCVDDDVFWVKLLGVVGVFVWCVWCCYNLVVVVISVVLSVSVECDVVVGWLIMYLSLLSFGSFVLSCVSLVGIM